MLILDLCLLPSVISAQIKFDNPKIINIYNKVQGPSCVYATDVDNDLFVDIVVADRRSYKTLWYKNNGNGTFSSPNLIDSTIANVYSKPYVATVSAGDLDGDDDIDVLCSWEHPVKYAIAWYKNIDGKGTFSDAIGIRMNEDNDCHSISVIPKDIDGDNDLDVVYAVGCKDEISWHENLNGKGSFSNQRVITNKLENVHNICVIDFDQDYDMDIIATSDRSNKVVWFKNVDGKGKYSEEIVISSSAIGAWGIGADDFNNDNYIDVIYCGLTSENCLAWFENIDNSTQFSPNKIIPTSLNMPLTLCTADFDIDGDKDVICADFNTVTLIENLGGKGGFGVQQNISSLVNWVMSVTAADLDNDGDMDVLSASYDDNKIALYENLTNPTNIYDKKRTKLNYYYLKGIYPNPLNNSATIEYYLSKPSFVTLTIYNIRGYKLEILVREFQKPGNYKINWHPKDLQSGVYLCALKCGRSLEAKKIILLK